MANYEEWLHICSAHDGINFGFVGSNFELLAFVYPTNKKRKHYVETFTSGRNS